MCSCPGRIRKYLPAHGVAGSPQARTHKLRKGKNRSCTKIYWSRIDGQGLSNKALTQAIGLAKALGAKMTVLNVTPRWSAGASGGDVAVMYPAEAHEANIADAAKQLLSKSAAIAQSAGVLCDTAHASDFCSSASLRINLLP